MPRQCSGVEINQELGELYKGASGAGVVKVVVNRSIRVPVLLHGCNVGGVAM